MALTMELLSIRSRNESSEASSSDEAFVLVTVANLRPPLAGVPIPPLPDLQVVSYGIFGDIDDDDPDPVFVNGRPFWGPDGRPRDIIDPSDVAIVLSVMEHDHGTPAQYVEAVNAKALVSLAASAGDPSPTSRATRLTTDVGNVLNAIDVPIPFTIDDDHIGTQQFVLGRSDLLTGGQKDRTVVIGNNDAEFELVVRIRFQGWQHGVPSAGEVAVAPGTSPTSWYTTPENVQHIAYVGTDGQIHECFFFVGGSDGWQHSVPSAGQVAVAPGTSPTSWYTTPENVQHIAYVGTDGQIHECFFFVGGSDGWQHGVPSAGQVAVAPGTSPTSWYTTPENVQHIAYVGTDGQIHECFFFVGGSDGWQHGVPSAGEVAVAPGTSPTSWYTTPENVQHIAYVGIDGQIHECFFFVGGSDGWQHGVPSAGEVAVAPGTSPTSWYTTPENVQHIAYVGTDGQIHQCFFFIGGFGGWQHEIVSMGEVPAAARTSPTSWYTTPENVQHIAYVGTDGQIIECFFFVRVDGDHVWFHGRPSAGRPPVAPGTSPTSWYTTPENVQHIGYVGSDGAIHECFFRIG